MRVYQCAQGNSHIAVIYLQKMEHVVRVFTDCERGISNDRLWANLKRYRRK